MNPKPYWIFWNLESFGSDVLILITPPANSPGISGEPDFITIRLSNILEGKISNEKAFLSDSELGSGEPFIKAKLYLSFRPRITTNLLSWTDAPLTLLNTSDTFVSGVFLKVSALTPSWTTALLLCCLTNSIVDSLLDLALTVTVVISKVFSLNFILRVSFDVVVMNCEW